ncbi:MAG TPA: endopeptidase La [Tissierellales bacterium]|nr:endopeptidase La [Tissierellales bacterium]
MNNGLYEIKNKQLPLIPLRGITIFPHMIIHFDVGRKKSINALEEAMEDDSLILLSTQKDFKIEEPETDEFYHVGTVAKIKQMIKLPGGSIRVLVEGINRGKIIDFTEEEKYFSVVIEEMVYKPEELEKDIDIEAMMGLVTKDFEDYIDLNSRVSPEVILLVSDIDDPGKLADVIASYISIEPEKDQEILENFNVYERLETLHRILLKEIEILKVEERIDERIKKQIGEIQKEYYLKEQIKAIQKELGEEDGITEEVNKYKVKIDEIDMPKEVKEKAIDETERLYKLSSNSPEIDVIRNYLDWIVELPWDLETEDKINIKKSRQVLNKDHYGLEDVKERVLEFIAVKKLSNSMKGPILCLVGPPGVGKTSIASSVAKALNRNFVRMSLGGIRDEAEIRGHRRTYIGALPGRIISLMKKSGSKNPVFLLDEIDKLNEDFRGSPASALLEVLDPEQNNTFTDNFLEVPFDLSKVMFIATANTLESIPAPLLDRMEIIRIHGYTEEEKFKIAMNHLFPKQLKEHSLKENSLAISENAMKKIISSYTRESGVRNLEKNIANICRKGAKEIVEEDKKVIRVTKRNLEKYLGTPRYRKNVLEEENQVGVAIGLAWTAVGGEILPIEASKMKGTGKLQLTGHLGNVMQESARAGISYIRANGEKFDLDNNFYKENDIHIHVPEGAIPKDGPSAGITMATAVVSALTEIPVNREVAMTGEITLTGRVLPVGGIKEKALAASRAGIKKILLSTENEKDLEEIPDNIKRKVEFRFVKNMDEVLKYALLDKGDLNACKKSRAN